MGKSRAIAPWMRGIVDDYEKHENKINALLKKNEVSSLNFAEYIRIIKQQIVTAENRFTMAFVGEFNSGKSTIINSLLELESEKELSCEPSPDTALSTRIMYKDSSMEYDAEIIYIPDTYENEKVDWETAKRYTSQVSIDNNPEIADRASKIDEVRYYVSKDILTVCNILDLPGTGTGTHREHTNLTNEKIFEADVVFWVVSTSSEADKNAVANLEKISSKIIPIINVWQFEKEGICGEFSAEEMKKLIMDKYETYFNSKEEPIIYYAKEIEYAQQNGIELREEWGKSKFAYCLEKLVFSEGIDLEQEKVNRIKHNLRRALDDAKIVSERKKEEIDLIMSDLGQEESEADLFETSLYSIFQSVDAQIKDSSKVYANNIIEYFTAVTDTYIEDEMQSANVSMLIRSVKRDKKEQLIKEMDERYRKEYLKLEEKPCWYDEIMQDYIEEVKILLNGAYARFKIESKSFFLNESEASIPSDFLSSIIDQSINAFLETIGGIILTIISAVILGLLPGGEIIDAISVSLLGKASLGADHITKKKENVKSRARLSISIQKNGISRKICEVGQSINEDCKARINEFGQKQKNAIGEKKSSVKATVQALEAFIDCVNNYCDELESY